MVDPRYGGPKANKIDSWYLAAVVDSTTPWPTLTTTRLSEWTWSKHVHLCDRQTDRQTDRQMCQDIHTYMLRWSRGWNCTLTYWLCTTQFRMMQQNIHVSIKMLDNQKFVSVTDDAVWKLHKLMGRSNRDGQPRRPQELWSISPQVLWG